MPQPVAGEPGLLIVDATWGKITPMILAPGVATLGELELIEHITAGRPLIDTRPERLYRAGTIPGARSIPHEQLTGSIGSLDPGVSTVFFCNGPQCAATPEAIATLLAGGYPPSAILYYRGGIHDWMTLGLPLEVPA